jgi:transaldolase
MANYRVITLAMAVKNNRIAEFNQIVDDSELTTNPSLLIKEGFIEAVEEEDAIDVEAEIVLSEKELAKIAKAEAKAKLEEKK